MAGILVFQPVMELKKCRILEFDEYPLSFTNFITIKNRIILKI